MGLPIGDPQGTQARAIDTERTHPTSRQEDALASYGRKQLIGLALFVAVPVILYFVVHWLS